ncbi:MAG: hypothetical protein Kow0088_11050 [Anaerolineales bacterium]
MPLKRYTYISSIFLFNVLLILSVQPAPPLFPAPPSVQAELWSAFNERLQAEATHQPLTFALFHPELDTAFITADGSIAILWLALRDDHGQRVATEPGLLLARRKAGKWHLLLPGDADWETALSSIPQQALPLEVQSLSPKLQPNQATLQAALGGYYLPYAAGTARRLEGSIAHFQSMPELGYPSCSIEYCRYAYDFTDRQPFPLLASKKGVVIGSRDTCQNGNPTCTNYIVLRNPADGAYQIYLHLAHGTIPNKYSPGTVIQRGQYIGDSDDTGYSTSQHVHFMVTKSIWMGSDGYYWGQSVDIRFADVAINTGIPRTCYEVTHFPIYDNATDCLGNKLDPRNPANDWYISGNAGAFPPSGDLSLPVNGETVLAGVNPLLHLTATAADDVRVVALRLLIKIDGEWIEAGPIVTQPTQTGLYAWEVDLCSIAPLNGDTEIALRVWDYEGNVITTSTRSVRVDHACPPSTSQLHSAQTFDSTAVRLNWDAEDNGAAFSAFELQWRTEPGVWEEGGLLTIPAEQRSVWFAGEPGGSYAFRLRARDLNHQAEDWPANNAAETVAVLPQSCQPDPYEADDTPDQARPLRLNETATGNLCPEGNADYYRLEIDQAGRYLLSAFSQNGGAAVRLGLFAADTVTQLSAADAPAIGTHAFLRFQSNAATQYYLKVEPLVPTLMGTEANYTLILRNVQEAFLPLINR